MNWMLGLVFLVCSIPLWIVRLRVRGRYSAVSRLSQDQAGDLATAVEESVHGIRVLKAFGRGKHALTNFPAQAESSARHRDREGQGSIAGIWLWLLLVPDVDASRSASWSGCGSPRPGSSPSASSSRSSPPRRCCAWPIESIGFLLAFALTPAPRPTGSSRSSTARTDHRPRAAEDDREPARSRSPSTGVRFRYQDSPDRFGDLLDGVDLELEPGETMALVGLTGIGQDHHDRAHRPASTTSPAGRSRLDGVDIRDLSRDELRTHIAMAFEDATLFSRLGARQRAARPPSSERGTRRGRAVLAEALRHRPGRLRVRPARRRRHQGRRRGPEPVRRAAAAARARAGGRGEARRCSCSTTRCRRWTSTPRRASRPRCAACSHRTTALIVAHRPSTVMLADRVALLEDGRITAVGTHSDLLATSEHYRFVISSLDDDTDQRTDAGAGMSVVGVEGEERDDLTKAESRLIRDRSAAAARVAAEAAAAAGHADHRRGGRQHRGAGRRTRADRLRDRRRAARAAGRGLGAAGRRRGRLPHSRESSARS